MKTEPPEKDLSHVAIRRLIGVVRDSKLVLERSEMLYQYNTMDSIQWNPMISPVIGHSQSNNPWTLSRPFFSRKKNMKCDVMQHKAVLCNSNAYYELYAGSFQWLFTVETSYIFYWSWYPARNLSIRKFYNVRTSKYVISEKRVPSRRNAGNLVSACDHSPCHIPYKFILPWQQIPPNR